MSVGYQFDDSTTVGFKFGYYLSGLNTGLISNNSESYEFRYSPDHFSDHIHSMAHGKQPSTRSTFNFHLSERITVVEGSLRPIELHSADRTNRSFDTVTEFRFFSSNDRWSDRFLDLDTGRKFRENFTGYTLGYIRSEVSPIDMFIKFNSFGFEQTRPTGAGESYDSILKIAFEPRMLFEWIFIDIKMSLLSFTWNFRLTAFCDAKRISDE